MSGAEELLTAMATRAVEQGYARPSFVQALLARERAHPTGLPTVVPAAVPHADPEHVLRPGIGLTLVDEVPFVQMGTEDVVVPVRLAVLLLVTDPAQQVQVLSQVVELLRSPEWFERASGARTPAELVEAVGLDVGT